MTTILHFADLHLDRSFAGLGMASSEAGKRREELRAALRRIVDLAIVRDVDIVTVGGDLFEHDRITPDTVNFIREQFARVSPRRVLVAPGNHDPFVPDSPYWRLDWPDNVHLFGSMTWEAVKVGDCQFWGVGHRGPTIRDNLLARLRVDGGGLNVALMHGSDMSAVPEGKDAHCPFEHSDVVESGVDFALLGHYHEMRLRPTEAPRYAYPGSPEPLNFGEEGVHFVLVVEAGAGAVSVEAVPINEVSYRTETVEVSGLSSSDAVREKVQSLSAAGETAGDIVRVVLAGQPDVDLDLDPDGLLHSCAPYFRYLDIDNRTQVPFDLAQMRTESTTRGAFIRIIEERLESAEGEEREVLSGALHYGLRAFTGMAVRQR